MRFRSCVLTMGALLGLAACATAPPAADASAVRSAIERQNALWASALEQGNAADVVDRIYTPDAIVMPPGGELERGTAAIRENVRGVRFDELDLRTEEVEVHGDVAIERGTWVLAFRPPGAPGPVTERGKYLVVWRRQEDGAWKIYRDIWNSDTAPPM